MDYMIVFQYEGYVIGPFSDFSEAAAYLRRVKGMSFHSLSKLREWIKPIQSPDFSFQVTQDISWLESLTDRAALMYDHIDELARGVNGIEAMKALREATGWSVMRCYNVYKSLQGR